MDWDRAEEGATRDYSEVDILGVWYKSVNFGDGNTTRWSSSERGALGASILRSSRASSLSRSCFTSTAYSFVVGVKDIRFRAKKSNLQSFEDSHLQAKARIWPWLSYVCHIRTTTDQHSLYAETILRVQVFQV